MPRFGVFFRVFVLCILQCTIAQKCAENEFYSGCGTACPKRCGKLDEESCDEKCVAGCHCLPSFCLDDNNTCVPSSGFPDVTTKIDTYFHSSPSSSSSYIRNMEEEEVCQPNANYTECGTACPRRCWIPPATFCITVCVPGCECLPGYCLKANGKCRRTPFSILLNCKESTLKHRLLHRLFA